MSLRYFASIYEAPFPRRSLLSDFRSKAKIRGIMTSELDILRSRLEQAEAALARSERLVIASRYAGAIMHEVNNPLEAITNLVYLTKQQRDDPDQVVRNMEIIDEQLVTLGRVTSQALTFHRQQNEAKEVDLVEIATSAIKLHADRLARHGVVLEQRFRGPAIAKVFGTEILQVISNLLMNAIDAVPANEGRLLIGVKLAGNCVHICVHDSGPGIPESVVDRLFEPYATSKPAGTGLGLWLSKRIVSKHRGSLRFRTSRSRGACGTMFRISLPRSA
jgi:signal transduction histidine kinase